MGDVISCDTETPLIVNGRCPRLVVLSIDGELVHQRDVDRDVVEGLLLEHTAWANAPFDLAVLAQHAGCLPAVFDALAHDRVHDVLTRQKLLDIADGLYRRRVPKYSLGGVAKLYGYEKDASDPWRLRYGELIDTPLDAWPAEALEYASHDTIVTGQVFRAQKAKEHDGVFLDQYRQARAHWALHLSSLYGIAVDQHAVEVFAKSLDEAWTANRKILIDAGIVRPNGSRDTKRAQELARAAGMTKTTASDKALSLTKEDCDASGDPVMIAYARDTHLAKLQTTYVKMLRSRPRLRPSYEELVETGRTSARDPNIQNLPREPGVRECLVADPGDCIVSVDVDKAELVSLAQIILRLFGESHLADVINAGIDPHCTMGARLHGVTFEEFMPLYESGDFDAGESRQDSKPANFGFIGFMSENRFITYAAGQGRRVTLDRAKFMKAAWKQEWPDILAYQRWVNDLLERTGGFVQHPGSLRLRGGLSGPDCANGFMQGMTADAMKEAAWELACAHFGIGDWPRVLTCARTVAFIHDEFLVRCPVEHCHEVGESVKLLVETVYRRWTPDVRVSAGAKAFYRWSKKAKAVYEGGRLVPWK